MPCGMFRIVRGGLAGRTDYPTSRRILKPGSLTYVESALTLKLRSGQTASRPNRCGQYIARLSLTRNVAIQIYDFVATSGDLDEWGHSAVFDPGINHWKGLPSIRFRDLSLRFELLTMHDLDGRRREYDPKVQEDVAWIWRLVQ